MVGFSNCVLATNNACNESEIYTTLDPATSSYSFSLLAVNISNCAGSGHLASFFTTSYSDPALAFDLLISNGSHIYMLNLLSVMDADRLIRSSIEAEEGTLNETLAGLSGFDIAQYMNMVKLRWGQPAYEALASNMIFTQQVKLGEHHLYGSSRLGIKYADTTLFQRDITINGFDTLGNILVDDVLDSVKLQVDTVRYYNMLALKQYELTNHLGNVLATVNDRKTPVIVASALAGYKADVVSATYYYPFGSAMQTWGNDSSYKFGFNGQEKDDEIWQGMYGALYWEYDSRLGSNGRWNIDPVAKPNISPYATFGNNPVFHTDPNGDDWFEDQNGNVAWHDNTSQGFSDLQRNSWTNIGTTYTITTDSYIPEDNDGPLPIRYGVDGSKLFTEISITGVYDKEHNLSFSYKYTRVIGKTFDADCLEGTQTVPGKTNTPAGNSASGVMKNNALEIETHTTTPMMETYGLRVIGSNVDVNQQMSISISANGALNVAISHGTYPSVRMTGIGSAEKSASNLFSIRRNHSCSHMAQDIFQCSLLYRQLRLLSRLLHLIGCNS